MAFDKSRAQTTADKHIENGDYKRAAVQLNQICRNDPSDVRTRLKLGELYQKLGRLEVSLRTFIQVADSYIEQGHVLKAVAVYNKMLGIDSGLHTVHLALARSYKQLGLVNDAATQYKEVIRILSARERYDERLAVIEEMMALDPDNAAALVRLGEEYISQGRIEDATVQFKRASKTLESHGRLDECIRVLERLVFHDASDVGTRTRLAGMYMGRDDVHMALPHLRACFHVKQDNQKTLELLAELFAQMGQENKAAAVLRALAQTHHNNRLLDERDATLERLLEINPNDVEARQLLEGSAKISSEMNAEIVFDDLDVDEIFLDEERVEVLDDVAEVQVAPPPLPIPAMQDESLTTVERDPAYQSGELEVIGMEEQSVLGRETDVIADLLVDDEDEVEMTVTLDDSTEIPTGVYLPDDPDDELETVVQLWQEDDSSADRELAELDRALAEADGFDAPMQEDDLSEESLEAFPEIVRSPFGAPELEVTEEPAEDDTDIPLESRTEVEEEAEFNTSLEPVEEECAVAEASESIASESDRMDDFVDLESDNESSDFDQNVDRPPDAMDEELDALLKLMDKATDSEDEELLDLAVVQSKNRQKDIESESIMASEEEIGDLLEADALEERDVGVLDSDEQDDWDSVLSEAGLVVEESPASDPSHASDWDEWDHLDAEIQEASLAGSDDDDRYDSEQESTTNSRLAMPIVTVDWDGSEDVMDMESEMVSLDAMLAEEDDMDERLTPTFSGIHRVAVPMGSTSMTTGQSTISGDQDDWVVEVLVDDDSESDALDMAGESTSVSDELTAELDEFDFFFTNGFHAEAAAVLDEMETSFGPHPEVVRRREALHQFDV